MLYFDIGAFIGDKTACYLTQGHTVIAVEPNPDTAKTLRNRFLKEPKVTIVEAAVSDFIGETDLAIPSAGLYTLSTICPKHWYTHRFGTVEVSASYKVKVTTLDELIKEYGVPDFCKVDSEGSEEQIFRGLSQQIHALSFEYTSEHPDSLARCLRLLHRHGTYTCSYSFGDWWNSDWMRPYQLLHAVRKEEKGNWGDVMVKYDS